LFSRRRIKPELLEHLTAEDARENLADLIRLNARFGGHAVLRSALREVVEPSEAFTLLDVGCASGDTARLIGRTYPAARITSLDNSLITIKDAPQPKLIGDAFDLPLAAGSFDLVMCSLLLHHFPDELISKLLATFYATARRALVVCDLERHVVPFLFLPLSKPLLGWCDVTVHDGMASVRAGFRRAELKALASKAGIAAPDVRVHRPAFRLSLIAKK
jgi:SAM-dependent methyltransferase